jgi:hypothetical protein
MPIDSVTNRTVRPRSTVRHTSHPKPPAHRRATGHSTRDTFTPASSRTRSTGTAAATTNAQVLTKVNANDPTLKTLANAHLRSGRTGTCVRTTLNNLQRSGVPHPAATGDDVGNNPRGAMVQLMRNNGWTSLQTSSSTTETIKSPYGTVQANVIPASEYKALADAGKIPSGALVFQTRHDSWNSTSRGSHGFDMGIARNGGRTTFNYADMHGPMVYRGAQSVVVLVPGSSVQ